MGVLETVHKRSLGKYLKEQPYWGEVTRQHKVILGVGRPFSSVCLVCLVLNVENSLVRSAGY